ncbi:Cytochrome c oxidase subunit 2 precursor [Rosistilla carotiformis]|uniref:Cytochrome c oxidase subunit 2 n=1 Tax=Rosistilla carotiformis TaxID=2528017 RepID=A0A518JXV3_9BACT|nr:cytochrome c oxidase subunit II [Rosistilla carotiformis]QDV70366.1 Cytochrome c oxidase subunit 2 precursor [Rosistilla carotiformis]
MQTLQNLSFVLADVSDGFWFPKTASNFGTEVDFMYKAILWISVAFFVPMMIYMGWAAFKFSKPKGTKAEGKATHNTALELAWSVGPCFLLIWMFYRGSVGYLDMREPPSDAREVQVTAQKWSWLFDYGSGIMNPELHVVKDQPTKLVMRSKDVLHAMYIPAFRVKRDIVPGRYNILWFTPTIATDSLTDEEMQWKSDDPAEAGNILNQGKYFDFFCAEYCGKDHSNMQGKVVVHETQDDYDLWLESANRRPDDQTPEQYGEFLYTTRGCKGCHSADGTAGQCPTFLNSFGAEHEMTDGSKVAVDENYIRESILNPKAKVVKGYPPVMPSFQGQFNDDQIDSVIAYIKSLKK